MPGQDIYDAPRPERPRSDADPIPPTGPGPELTVVMRGRRPAAKRTGITVPDGARYRLFRAASRVMAESIRARCVNACGKFPSCSPVDPISSEYSPRWLE